LCNEKIPRTLLRLTPKGSEAFRVYKRKMRAALERFPE